MFDKKYVTYELELDRRGNPIADFEEQLEWMRDMYRNRFGVDPEEILIGPIIDKNGQTRIREGEVWMPIPSKEMNNDTYLLATGDI